MMITDTMNTRVVGRECDSLQRRLFSGPKGQYLLRASDAEKGMVAARARSVTARLKISKFRGVRTWKFKLRFDKASNRGNLIRVFENIPFDWLENCYSIWQRASYLCKERKTRLLQVTLSSKQIIPTSPLHGVLLQFSSYNLFML